MYIYILCDCKFLYIFFGKYTNKLEEFTYSNSIWYKYYVVEKWRDTVNIKIVFGMRACMMVLHTAIKIYAFFLVVVRNERRHIKLMMMVAIKLIFQILLRKCASKGKLCEITDNFFIFLPPLFYICNMYVVYVHIVRPVL